MTIPLEFTQLGEIKEITKPAILTDLTGSTYRTGGGLRKELNYQDMYRYSFFL